MRSKLLLTLVLWKTCLFAQTSYPVYYNSGEVTISSLEKTRLLNELDEINSDNIISFTLQLFHDDTGNKTVNRNISNKRGNLLKDFLKDNGFNQPITIEYVGEISIENINSLSKEELALARNNTRKIEVFAILKDQNAKSEANFKALQNTVYFKDDNINPESEDLQNLLIYLKQIDFNEIEYITLNTYNKDTGAKNKNKNRLISRRRAEELRKAINKEYPKVRVLISYKGDVKPEIKEEYTPDQIEALKNKIRRIEVTLKKKTAISPAIQNNNIKTVSEPKVQDKKITPITTITPQKEVQKTNKSVSNQNTKYNFSKKDVVFSIHYDSDKMTTPKKEDELFLKSLVSGININSFSSVLLSVNNVDSGDKNFDSNISKQRAENIKKIITSNSKLDVVIEYNTPEEIELKYSYSDEHVKFLKTKGRRIDIIPIKNNFLKDNIPSSNLVYEFSQRSRTGDRVHLKNGIFLNGYSIITKEIAEDLDIIAEQLKKHKEIYVEIQGYVCCTDGKFEGLDKSTGKSELSANRAKAVYEYLINKGIDPKRMRHKGYGNTRPLSLDEELNNRVELLVIRA